MDPQRAVDLVKDFGRSAPAPALSLRKPPDFAVCVHCEHMFDRMWMVMDHIGGPWCAWCVVEHSNAASVQ